MNKAKLILCLFAVIFFAGCTTASRINRDYQKIDFSRNQIDKQEAIAIAQKHVLEHREKNINISSAVIENKDTNHPVYWRVKGKFTPGEVWIVRFGPKILTSDFVNGILLDFRYYVAVDKTTGEVLDTDYGLADTL